MKKILCLLIVVSVCFTGTPASAPPGSGIRRAEVVKDTPELKHRVHVDVSSKDDTTKALIESYIKRELRSLGDVEIVDKKDAKYILVLVAIPLTSSGNKTGYTSIAIMRLSNRIYGFDISLALYDYQNTFVKDLSLEERSSRYPKIAEIAKEHSSVPTYHYPSLILMVNIADNDLQNTCKEIVAEFDVEVIEPIREIYR